MYRPELAEGAVVYWHLPSSVEARPGGVLIVR